MLPESTFDKIGTLTKCASKNQSFFHHLVDFQDFNFAPRDSNSTPINKHIGNRISIGQMHRLQAVLHSLVREWSSDGLDERTSTFLPILDDLKNYLPVTLSNAYDQRVLVPGCGLARLPLEIVAAGYSCEANEFSMFMLTTSHFILNGVEKAKEFKIYPWIDR